MPKIIFKVGEKIYTNDDVIRNMVNYILTSEYIVHFGQYGCFINPEMGITESIVASFNAVKKANNRMDGQLLFHIIVGFQYEYNIHDKNLDIVADYLGSYFFGKGFQVFWGTHFGSKSQDSYQHIHVVVNSINAFTGERYKATYDNMRELTSTMQRVCPMFEWSYCTKDVFYSI